ncbi:MAG: pyridoxal phosphate-dependent aminotransferase [Candidatus Eremiobacteraeota bacterium]|nr:pyridoxal phosphate-dependent aminotransferase [Candidatus Eremiobacteraeota bacterium]MBC5827834.1 pyridoxal phosphate-dependent aminotransferase [Candidatus Eremiobacteraeota bacterium]
MAGAASARVSALPPSGIRTISDRKRPTSIDLSIGQPSLRPEIAPFEAATDWIREHGCPYAPYAGIPELRERAAQIYGGARLSDAKNVCVTNGSQEAIYLAIKTLVEPGKGEVLICNPGYPSYARCCDLEGIARREFALRPEDGFQIRARDVLEAVRPATRLVIIGSPSNPTGAVMAAAEVDELARGLLDHRLAAPWVLFDEVYRELIYDGLPYRSITDVYPYGMCVHSLSKSCALTGLRLGFLMAPQEILDIAVRAHGLMLMSVSIFGQRVALEFMRSPDRLRAHHGFYVAQSRLMREAALAARLDFVEPQGAFYTMVRLPHSWRGRSADAAISLLDEFDVVTAAGEVFGSGAGDYLRVSWSASPADVREGFARIGEFLGRSA